MKGIPSRSNLVAVIIAALAVLAFGVVAVQNVGLSKRLTHQNGSIKSLTASNASLAKSNKSLAASNVSQAVDVHSLTETVTKRQPTLNYLKCQYARTRFQALANATAQAAYQNLASVLLTVPKGTPATDGRIVAASMNWANRTAIYTQVIAAPDTCQAPPSKP